MKLTGKDVLEAACVAIQGGGTWATWDALSLDAQEMYTSIAKQINTSHVEPLQEKIEALEDEEVIPSEAGVAMASAMHVQGEKVKNLLRLVQDFVDLIEDSDLMIEVFTDIWWEKKEASLSQAKELLKEEK